MHKSIIWDRNLLDFVDAHVMCIFYFRHLKKRFIQKNIKNQLFPFLFYFQVISVVQTSNSLLDVYFLKGFQILSTSTILENHKRFLFKPKVYKNVNDSYSLLFITQKTSLCFFRQKISKVNNFSQFWKIIFEKMFFFTKRENSTWHDSYYLSLYDIKT